jgi:hypothetical protein
MRESSHRTRRSHPGVQRTTEVVRQRRGFGGPQVDVDFAAHTLDN